MGALDAIGWLCIPGALCEVRMSDVGRLAARIWVSSGDRLTLRYMVADVMRCTDSPWVAYITRCAGHNRVTKYARRADFKRVAENGKRSLVRRMAALLWITKEFRVAPSNGFAESGRAARKSKAHLQSKGGSCFEVHYRQQGVSALKVH